MMKNSYLVLIITASLSLGSCCMHKMMFVEDQSKYEFEQTVSGLKLALEKNGWKVTEKADMREHYAQYGYEILNNITFEICKPEGAVDILKEDKFTRMVPLMPMRIAVYMKSDGNIYISRLRLGMMNKMTSGVVRDVMKVGAKDLENAVEELIQ